ncbi:hypothetical protein Megpolyxen_01715 (plasmid) [Candidatus Megaera polyxenophila]|nr:hypothetical protein Megpolyxen_01715 [Candidatus Megaera polyxenophila]
MYGNIKLKDSPSSTRLQKRAEPVKPLKMTSNDEIHRNNYKTQQVFSYFLHIIIAYLKGSGDFFAFLT